VSPKVTTEDSKGDRGARPGQAQAAARSKAARVVSIVFGVLATILALGAVLIVLGGNTNKDNSIVELVINLAEAISGPFSRTDGIFSFRGDQAASKNALLNWGIAAIFYLLIGRLLAYAIAPKGSR